MITNLNTMTATAVRCGQTPLVLPISGGVSSWRTRETFIAAPQKSVHTNPNTRHDWANAFAAYAAKKTSPPREECR